MNENTTAASGAAPALPPLPEPFIGVQFNVGWRTYEQVIRSAIGQDGVTSCFTAEQMRDYALAALASREASPAPLTDEQVREAFRKYDAAGLCRDATKWQVWRDAFEVCAALASPQVALVDTHERHLAVQAALIDLDRLSIWLTKYGVAADVSSEALGAEVGQYVNRLTRCEPVLATPVQVAPPSNLLPTDAMIHAAMNAYETSQATPMVRMRCALSAALARQVAPQDDARDAALWREHVAKLDALVTYCPTCCQGYFASKEMTRDEIIFECGKTVGRSTPAAKPAEEQGS